MRKPLLILAATAVLASGASFAATTKPAEPATNQSAPVKHKMAKKKHNQQAAAPAKKAE